MTTDARIELLEDRIAALERLVSADSPNAKKVGKQMSLREFINQKQPKTANDKGLVIAHYIETVRSEGAFNIDDLRSGFMEAKLNPPKNINDMVNKNIAKGLIMASGNKSGKRSWVLTNTGEGLAEDGFGERNNG